MYGSSERALLALAGAVAAWSTACGRVGFDAVASDAAVAPDAVIDAIAGDAVAPDALPEDIDAAPGRFSDPVLIEKLSDPSAAEDDPTLTADLLELYFESTRFDGMGDILVSRRNSPVEPWGAPELVAELSGSHLRRRDARGFGRWSHYHLCQQPPGLARRLGSLRRDPA